MRKIIFVLFFILFSSASFAACKKNPEMGANFYRCENKEAVCYFFSEGQPAPFQISCFRNN